MPEHSYVLLSRSLRISQRRSRLSGELEPTTKELIQLKTPRKAVIACIVSVVLAGGVISGVALGAGAKKHPAKTVKKKAASTTTTSTTTTGAFRSNEDATHEAGESAAVEAAEDAGVRPGGGGPGGRPNEDATHEASESAAREAAEDAGTTTTTTP